VTSPLEIAAVVLALAMVFCNIREIHLGWPLAAASTRDDEGVVRGSEQKGAA